MRSKMTAHCEHPLYEGGVGSLVPAGRQNKSGNENQIQFLTPRKADPQFAQQSQSMQQPTYQKA